MSESPYWKEGEIPDISGPTQYKQALVVSENLKAMEKSENFYNKEMDELCHSSKLSLTDGDLKEHHEKYFSKAVDMFRETTAKDEEFSSVCDKKLESKLQAQFQHFKLLNESKRKSEFVVKVTFVTTLALAGIGIYSMWRRRS